MCFSAGPKHHVSPPVTLFTFLPLAISHHKCHQHPLWLKPVNMATLLSAHWLLLSPLFALTLDKFIKRKEKREDGGVMQFWNNCLCKSGRAGLRNKIGTCLCNFAHVSIIQPVTSWDSASKL